MSGAFGHAQSVIPRALAVVALGWLGACGRIGFELLPRADAGDPAAPPLFANEAGEQPDAADVGLAQDGGSEPDSSPSPPCALPCINAHGSTSCVGGRCVNVCSQGYADCDGDPSNGCEANTESDPAHCGTCDVACNAGAELCQSGACQPSPCPAGRAECDGNAASRCEVDVTSSLNDCGFCGNACAIANASARCNAGSCELASCRTGFADCDGRAITGCEAALASDVTNCGSCGRVCPANGGMPICRGGACDTLCDLTGTYALKMNVAGSWSSGSYVTAGSGTFQFWMRLRGTLSGTTFGGTLTECGRTIPPFSAPIVNETFLYAYPTSLFDGSFLPASPTSVTLSSAAPGATLMLAPSAVQMGIDMAQSPFARDPVSGAWPTQASQIPSANRVDMDGDGHPGVTAEYADNYAHPRTGGTLFDPRSDNPYVASRVAFSLRGTLTSCTQSSGSASFTHVDTRIYACSLDSGECSATQAAFLDQNCLNYSLGAGTYTLVKVADSASCAAIRAAVP